MYYAVTGPVPLNAPARDDLDRVDGPQRKCGGCNFWFDVRDEGVDEPDPLCPSQHIMLCNDCLV